MRIHAPSRKCFQSLLRVAASSIAEPPWFAAPVDADEDQDSLTVIFHVPEKQHGHVQVQAGGQTVTVWGGRPRDRQRPMRVCALPCPIDARGLETARSGDLLHVRILKKRPATDSWDASSVAKPTPTQARTQPLRSQKPIQGGVPC
jgi:HSP20 family molecular chaperone IbpA